MERPVATMSDELWSWMCEGACVRDEVVADVRAKLLAGAMADPLAVADALLRRRPQFAA